MSGRPGPPGGVPPRLRLRLFGGFALEHEQGSPLGVSLHKAKALLAYLATGAQPTAPREALAELLWSESEPARARQSLRQLLLRLRRDLAAAPAPLLRLTAESVGLAREHLMLDVAEFERLVGEPSIEARLAAARVYAGEFLAGVRVEATVFEDWLFAARTRYADLAIAALVGACKEQREHGEIAAAIQSASRVLALDPLREDVHRHLMHLYLAQGAADQALAQYRRCRALLRSELEVAPDPETEELHRRIRARAPATAVAGGARPGPGKAAAGAEQAPPFVGRGQVLQAVACCYHAAAEGRAAFVALAGEAGLGKSRLLDEIGREVARQGGTSLSARARQPERGRCLAFWRELLEAAACEAGCGPPDERDDAAGAALPLLEGLQDRGPLVLLLDDLHWADDESLGVIYHVLRRLRRRVLLLVGSYRPERLAPASALAGVLDELGRDGVLTTIALGPLPPEETAELLRLGGARGRRAGAELRQWCEGNPRLLAELCSEAARGHAAEDAATRLGALVRAELAERLAPLGEGAKRVAEVAAVFGRAVDCRLLAPMLRLGEEETLRGLEALQGARLLCPKAEGFAFTWLRHRLALYHALVPERRRLLHAAAVRALEGERASGRAVPARELAHHCRAAGWLAEALRHELQAARGELQRGRTNIARRGFQRVAKRAGALGDSAAASALAAEATLGLAELAEHEGALEAAWRLLDGLEARQRRARTGRERAALLAALSRLAARRRDEAAALHYARMAVRAAGPAGQETLWSLADRLVARLHLVAAGGDADARLANLRDRAKRFDLPQDAAEGAAAAAVLNALQGELGAARAAALEAVALARRLPGRRPLALCLQVLGLVQACDRQVAPALATLARAGRLARRDGDLFRSYAVLGHKGLILSLAGRPAQALRELAAAQELAARLGTTFLLPLFRAWSAEALAMTGGTEAALEAARAAAILAAQANQPWPHSVALRTLAGLFAHRGQSRRAVRALRAAIAVQEGLGLRAECARSLAASSGIARARPH